MSLRFTLQEKFCTIESLRTLRRTHGTAYDIVYHAILDGINEGLDDKYGIGLEELETFICKLVDLTEVESAELLHWSGKLWNRDDGDLNLRRTEPDTLHPAYFVKSTGRRVKPKCETEKSEVTDDLSK